MKSDNTLAFPCNSAWGALARRNQGYKKVLFPLITLSWGNLWSIYFVLKFLLGCSEMSGVPGNVVLLTQRSSWRKSTTFSSYSDLSFLPPPTIDIHSFFFFFPTLYPLFHLEGVSWFSLVYYTSPTLTQKCTSNPGMPSHFILLVLRSILLEYLQLILEESSGKSHLVCYWDYQEDKPGAAVNHLVFL